MSLIRRVKASGSFRAASIAGSPSVFSPKSAAMRACFSGLLGAVKRKLAAAVSDTDRPWGTIGFSVRYPGGIHPLTIPPIG